MISFIRTFMTALIFFLVVVQSGAKNADQMNLARQMMNFLNLPVNSNQDGFAFAQSQMESDYFGSFLRFDSFKLQVSFLKDGIPTDFESCSYFSNDKSNEVRIDGNKLIFKTIFKESTASGNDGHMLGDAVTGILKFLVSRQITYVCQIEMVKTINSSGEITLSKIKFSKTKDSVVQKEFVYDQVNLTVVNPVDHTELVAQPESERPQIAEVVVKGSAPVAMGISWAHAYCKSKNAHIPSAKEIALIAKERNMGSIFFSENPELPIRDERVWQERVLIRDQKNAGTPVQAFAKLTGDRIVDFYYSRNNGSNDRLFQLNQSDRLSEFQKSRLSFWTRSLQNPDQKSYHVISNDGVFAQDYEAGRNFDFRGVICIQNESLN